MQDCVQISQSLCPFLVLRYATFSRKDTRWNVEVARDIAPYFSLSRPVKRCNKPLNSVIYVLTGGLKEFCRDYQNLCENAPVTICDVTDFPPSPTTCDSCPGRPQGTPVTAILPYLYLGNEEGAADEALIDRLSIKYILNLTPRCPNFFSQRPDLHYKQIKINDSNQEDIGQHFDEAIQFIGEC